MRSTVLCTAIRHGSQKEFDFAFDVFQSTKDSGLKRELNAALSCTKETWLLNKLLANQTASQSSSFDPISTLSNVASKPAGNLVAWTYLKNEWTTIYEKYGKSNGLISLLNTITNRFNTEQQSIEVNNNKIFLVNC